MIDVALAVLAGVLTIAAPCILPMLPILLDGSVGQTNRARPAFIALGFTLTFSAVALVFGIFSEEIGFSPDRLRDVAVLLLLVFGGLMVWPRPFDIVAFRLSGAIARVGPIGEHAGPGNAGGFVLGMTLGAVWTPCAGPVLGSILTLVATSRHLAWAAVLLVHYAIGAGIPMLVIAYGGQYFSTRIRQIARHSRHLQQGFGGVVLLTAVAIHYQYDTLVTVWLPGFYPNVSLGL
jgi:cytochrome c-type biogenesis protein